MDPEMLLHRNRRALMLQAKAGNDEERRAYRQFARDYSVQIDVERTKIASPDAGSSRRAEC